MNDGRPQPRLHRPTLIGAATACVLALFVGAPPALAQTGEDTAPASGSAEPAQPTAVPKGAKLLLADSRPRQGYYYGWKRLRFRLMLAGKKPLDVKLEIRRYKSRLLERVIPVHLQPGQKAVIPFDGLSSSGTALRGKFRFVVRGPNGRPLRLAKKYKRQLLRAPTKQKRKKKKKRLMRFGLFDYIFPVRGKHTYGDGIGAPRAGHSHQGQDVSAKCGTKLVAAQGGVVQVNSYQGSGAGYYVVIDTIGSGIDHVYMHLSFPSPVPVGSAVHTGQPIGTVGNTGRSSGCHLHFEMWSAPGWYEGGSFMDPAPYLRGWDKYS